MRISRYRVIILVFLLFTGCSNLTGWRIPGTEKGVGATTKVYLVLENVETMPEDIRTHGEIYVDDAFFGNTKRPTYYKFVGNALVVGEVQIEKDRIHTIKVVFPGYESFSQTRHFGTLAEYSVPFRLKRLPGELPVIPEPQPPEKRWYEFWKPSESGQPPQQPVAPVQSEPQPEQPAEKKWYEFWK
ncbi:hypothetical protein HZA56_00485 [Candidatus Poribacteria bacterium]|nr:hypothetical protein [Candidatus Poribacteria bacterium]